MPVHFSVDLDLNLPGVVVPNDRFVFRYEIIDRALFPRRGLFCSALFHLVIAWIAATWPIPVPRVPSTDPPQEYVLLADTLPNPPLPSDQFPSIEESITEETPAPRKAIEPGRGERSELRLTPFAGPRTIVSALPHATNFVQTILQPDLIAPALLDPLILSPNLIESGTPQLVMPGAPPPPEGSADQKPVSPVTDSIFPVQTDRFTPLLLLPGSREAGTAGQNLIVLSPAPAPTAPDPFPAGESIGDFSIEGARNPRAPSFDARAETANGDKTTSNSGTGSGRNPRGGVIPGITILGGESGDSGFAHAPPPSPRTNASGQTSYGLTIVSSGNTGGAVGDFGVFSNEAVFTVYIDVHDSQGNPLPSWALQYALAGGEAAARDVVSPPYPQHEELPQWPAEMARRYADALLVMSATIDEEGRVLNTSILQSPDAALSNALTEAFPKWVFQPATQHGQSVAVKVLLGVPVVLYQSITSKGE